MEQKLDIFAQDREIIHSWITEHIEEEYRNSIMKKMILPMFDARSGKKLRPLISLYVFQMLTGTEQTDDARIKALCSALEISHNASLIVDDVFDKDEMRRGKEAFFIKYGTFAALSGAYNLSAFVFDLATRTDNSKVVREVGRVGSALSSALFMSKDLVSSKIITRDHFMDILFRKTTALFQAATRCGALIAGVDEEMVALLKEFGYCFGTSYQLRDDILGIVGKIEDLGKLPVSDIENRFQSLITINAMEMVDGMDRALLEEFYLMGREYDLDMIREILVRSGAIEKVVDETIKLRTRALEILDKFPISDSRDKLRHLVNLINFDSVNLE